MYQARNVVQVEKALSSEIQQKVKTFEKEIRPEWRENWYDGLGYCKSQN